MRKMFAVVPIVLAPLLAGAQAGQWKPSNLAPLSLAQKADNELHSLNHTSADYVYRFRLTMGQGRAVGAANIKSQSTFRLALPLVGHTQNEKEAIKMQTLIANGGKMATYISVPSVSKAHIEPTPSARPLAPNMIDGWMRDNVRLLFAAVGSQSNPLQALVKQAQANSGFIVRTDVRTVMVGVPNRASDDPYHLKTNSGAQKVPIDQYRIYIQRTPAMTKKLGPLLYEVVIDSKYYLPITMNNIAKPGKVAYSTAMYQTRWDLHTTSYPARCFDLKAPTLQTRPL